MNFLCSEDTEKAVPALTQSGFTISNKEFSDAQWLIIDHYGLGERYERRARDCVPLVYSLSLRMSR